MAERKLTGNGGHIRLMVIVMSGGGKEEVRFEKQLLSSHISVHRNGDQIATFTMPENTCTDWDAFTEACSSWYQENIYIPAIEAETGKPVERHITDAKALDSKLTALSFNLATRLGKLLTHNVRQRIELIDMSEIREEVQKFAPADEVDDSVDTVASQIKDHIEQSGIYEVLKAQGKLFAIK